MPRECPVCGARIAALEARFCRRCGAPLKAAGAETTAGANTSVSPVAPTAPLTDEGRATSGLAAEESQRLHDHTSRIRRAEMEELLRRVARDHDGDGGGPLALTSANEPLQTVAASTTAPASTAEPSSTTATAAPKTDGDGQSSSGASPAQPSSARRRVSWRFLTLVICGLALVVVALAFIALRRSKASSTVGPAEPPPAEGAQPVAQAQEQEAGAPQIEPVALASPPPAVSPRPTPSPRAREGGAETGPPSTTQAPAAPGALPAPEASATQPAPAETAVTVSPADHYQRGVQLWATDRRAALQEFRAAVPAVPDAYYYLGSEYYSEGRDVKSLSDGELRAALNYFTRATSGPHSAQANRYVQALGKEYDRRKKPSRN
jgi:hypothetical protein